MNGKNSHQRRRRRKRPGERLSLPEWDRWLAGEYTPKREGRARSDATLLAARERRRWETDPAKLAKIDALIDSIRAGVA